MNSENGLVRTLSMIGFLSIVFMLTIPNSVKGQISFAYFSSNAASVNSYAEAMGTKTTTNNITLQYSVGSNYAAGWKVKVKANGNFSNGTSTLPSQYVSLVYSGGGSGVSGSQVALTATETDLINSTQSIGSYSAHSFNSVITGGVHMFNLTTGTYSTTITVTFYNNAGVLIATKNNIVVSFVMNFDNTCSGAQLQVANDNFYKFSTYAETQAGATVTNALKVQYSPGGANCVGWSLKVRANGDFVNGQSSIPAHYVSLRFNSVLQGSPSAAAIGVSNTPVTLSSMDTELINHSNAGFQSYTVHGLDMIIQGGPHLQVVAPGDYTCPLTFTLYNQNGQLVSTFVKNLVFQIGFSYSFSYTITIQDPVISLDYTTPVAFTTGVSVTKTNGLRVYGTSAHQVIVKTSTDNLTSGSSTIPVSVVNLQVTPPAGKPGIVTTTRSLSTSDQIIITNAVGDSNYHTIDYTLRYYINGGNNAINTAANGTYSTQVYYIVLPL